MKTDVISVSSRGEGLEKVLQQVEKVAAYKDLSPKNTLHLRLLAEELVGMMRSITGETKGEFWMEDDKNEFRLHLRTWTSMDFEKREQLLAASTSGKNEAARGLMGRLRNFFEQGGEASSLYMYGPDMGEFSGNPALGLEWSMSAYQRQLEAASKSDEKAREMWDELEKSVVTHVADEIKVSIRGEQAEMVIYKKMA